MFFYKKFFNAKRRHLHSSEKNNDKIRRKKRITYMEGKLFKIIKAY